MTADEIHRAVFVAAQRGTIQDHVGADNLFEAAAIAGIGVKDLALRILEECTETRQLVIGTVGRRKGEIEIDAALRQFFL